jgi:hypothetical protein
MNITDICNLALNHIGRETIASLDEDTEPARTCKMHYDLQRQTLLRAYTWSFAKKYTKLAEINTKTPGWKYTYAYPNDCVMARKIYNEDNTWCALWKNRAGNFDQVLLNDNTKALVCNHEDAYLEYTYDAKDANLFPADFAQALSYYLAAAICMPLTGSQGLLQHVQAQGMGVLEEAKFTMMGERNRVPEYPSKYYKARW